MRQPEVAKVSSSRVTGTGTPIPIRAKRRAAMNDSQGISNNPFTILQDLSVDVLDKIARNCGISLGESEDEIDDAIDLIKAKELAQATLAEAQKKNEESQPKKSVVEVEESDDDANEEHMKIIQEIEEVDDEEMSNFMLEVAAKDYKGKKKIDIQ